MKTFRKSEMLLERLYINKCTVNIKIFRLLIIKKIMEMEMFNVSTHPVARTNIFYNFFCPNFTDSKTFQIMYHTTLLRIWKFPKKLPIPPKNSFMMHFKGLTIILMNFFGVQTREWEVIVETKFHVCSFQRYR